MPGETTSEMTEQQVSSVDEDLLKQSKPDLPDSKLIPFICYCLFDSILTYVLGSHLVGHIGK